MKWRVDGGVTVFGDAGVNVPLLFIPPLLLLLADCSFIPALPIGDCSIA